jgi:hypothetical protein
MEISATKLAVGDSFQTKIFLKSNHVPDCRIFDSAQLRAIDGAAAVAFAGVEQRRRAQEAADVIGAKRGRAANSHCDFSEADADTSQRRVRAVAGKASIMRVPAQAGYASGSSPHDRARGVATIPVRPAVAPWQIITQ